LILDSLNKPRNGFFYVSSTNAKHLELGREPVTAEWKRQVDLTYTH
jgi:hypothetical protein